MANGSLEFAVASRGAAIVNRENSKTLASHDVIEELSRAAPALQHNLRRRPAVDIHDQRNLAAGRSFSSWSIRGKKQAAVKNGSILRLEFHKLRGNQSIIDNAARLPNRSARATHGARSNARRGESVGIGVGIMLEIGRASCRERV